MAVRRTVAGYRPPSDRVTQLRAENAKLRAEIRTLRVTLAVAQYAHPNPPLADATPPVRRGPRLRRPGGGGS